MERDRRITSGSDYSRRRRSFSFCTPQSLFAGSRRQSPPAQHVLSFPRLARSLWLLILLFSPMATAAVPARLQRIEIHPGAASTQLRFKLQDFSSYTATYPSSTVLRLRFIGTTSPSFRHLQSLKDPHVSGIQVRQRMGDTLVDITARDRVAGFRITPLSEAGAIRVDVGPAFKGKSGIQVLPGRERILQGAEKLVREFETPIKGMLPFVPSDPKLLKKTLSDGDAKILMAGEAALYKGHDTDAETLFRALSPADPQTRGAVFCRLGEALYGLQKYSEAIKAFAEGERLWPEFLPANPTAAYSYADSLIRTGNYPHGRRELTRLLTAGTDKTYVPILMVRLGDVQALQGEEQASINTYQSVKKLFPGSRGASYAAMQLADRRMLAVNSGNYAELTQEYRQIQDVGDFSLRDEALFKEALLESLFGPELLALAKVSDYEKKYPRGVFAAIARSMREELLAMVIQGFMGAGDLQGLITLTKDNRDYLANALNIPQFLPRLVQGFAANGQLKDEIGLFTNLAEKYGATGHGPYLWSRVLDDAIKLGDQSTAERAATRFLELFPKHADAPLIKEKLAGFHFQHNDLAAVASELGWLLQPKSRASEPISYYYLGKALVKSGRHKQAGTMLQAYIAMTKASQEAAPYLLDAYYERSNVALATGDRKTALSALRAGAAEAPKERRAQFLYKLGQVELQLNHPAEARKYWEQVAADQTDSDWQTLATQALEDLTWQQERAGKKGSVSK